MFRLTDRMEKYSVISPDLTRNDPARTNCRGKRRRKLRHCVFAGRIA